MTGAVAAVGIEAVVADLTANLMNQQKGQTIILLLIGILILIAAGGVYYTGKFQVFESQNSIVEEKSGIMGKVVLGPTCPVVGSGMESECQDKPYQGTVAVKTSDGIKEITKFTSDTEGNFKVSLAPGNYLLESVSNNRFPFSKPQNVTVEKNQFTNVNISFDTGIR